MNETSQRQLKEYLEKKLNLNVKENESMSKYTTLRVGGYADLFVDVSDNNLFAEIYKKASELKVPIFVFGGGSNILVGDKGIRGLVIRNSSSQIEIKDIVKSIKINKTDVPRKDSKLGLSSVWTDMKYEEEISDGRKVMVSAGTALSALIHKTLKEKLTGLEWFTGIPGTIGGAVWNNIHGADWFFGDFISEVYTIDSRGQKKVYKKEDLNLKYNHSDFQTKNEIIVSAEIILPYGNISRAKATAEEWKKRKAFQPRNSAGSTFSNLSEEVYKNAGLENGAAGFVIDKILNMRGYKIEGASVFAEHGNFIVTDQNTTARNVKDLIELIQTKALEKIGIELQPEIVFVGEF